MNLSSKQPSCTVHVAGWPARLSLRHTSAQCCCSCMQAIGGAPALPATPPHTLRPIALMFTQQSVCPILKNKIRSLLIIQKSVTLIRSYSLLYWVIDILTAVYPTLTLITYRVATLDTHFLTFPWKSLTMCGTHAYVTWYSQHACTTCVIVNDQTIKFTITS